MRETKMEVRLLNICQQNSLPPEYLFQYPLQWFTKGLLCCTPKGVFHMARKPFIGRILISKPVFLTMWLSGVVVSALGIRARCPGFESRVAPLFHWVATLGKLFTHIASAVSQLQETWVQKGVFGA